MTRGGEFQATRWSLIAAARSGDADRMRYAREQLCTVYWYPLYAFVRRSGRDAEEARDLTQAFFAHLLEKELFEAAIEGRGKLRSLLLAALRRFLCDHWRREQRVCRAVEGPLSIDGAAAEQRYAREPHDQQTPEAIYERRWALLLLERTLLSVREDYAKRGKAGTFDALKPFLTLDGDEPSAAAAGALLGLDAGMRVPRAWRFPGCGSAIASGCCRKFRPVSTRKTRLKSTRRSTRFFGR
jgi:DNA-directed RNA polymerase specialized sigma24 family protein